MSKIGGRDGAILASHFCNFQKGTESSKMGTQSGIRFPWMGKNLAPRVTCLVQGFVIVGEQRATAVYQLVNGLRAGTKGVHYRVRTVQARERSGDAAETEICDRNVG